MKTTNLQKMVVVIGVAGLAFAGLAQSFGSANPSQPAAVSVPVAQLPYGVAQIVQLAQAKVADDTIIAYVKSSAGSYDLDANQILYLRQQGVSDAVLATMLSQPKPAMATNPAPAPQPVVSTPSPAPVAAAPVAPTVTYVQTVPAPVYYYQPYYQPYYYPAYGVSPALSLSFAWGGGSHGGGWHGGGGWHH